MFCLGKTHLSWFRPKSFWFGYLKGNASSLDDNKVLNGLYTICPWHARGRSQGFSAACGTCVQTSHSARSWHPGFGFWVCSTLSDSMFDRSSEWRGCTGFCCHMAQLAESRQMGYLGQVQFGFKRITHGATGQRRARQRRAGTEEQDNRLTRKERSIQERSRGHLYGSRATNQEREVQEGLRRRTAAQV